MPDKQIDEIIERSPLIVCGYAFFKREDGFISILNLNHPDCALVINKDGEMIATNMDQIEQQIVLDLCRKNLQFMDMEE